MHDWSSESATDRCKLMCISFWIREIFAAAQECQHEWPSQGATPMSDLQRLARALKVIEGLDAQMPIRQARCLLELAQINQPMHQTDLAKQTGLSVSTMSRYVTAFGPKGLGLVTNEKNPEEGRCRVVALTRKGRTFLKAIADSAECAETA